MTTTKKIVGVAPLLLLAMALAACTETTATNGKVKSIHVNDDPTGRHYVVCQKGAEYREVTLSKSVIDHIKVDDVCPYMPSTTTTTYDPWRR